MGRSKSKPRAQRKFAQGAFVPQQNQPTTSTATGISRAFHRAVNLPGPVTYNNCSAKDMLNIMSLGKLHLHLNINPVVELEYDQELEKRLERTVKKKLKIKDESKDNSSLTKYGLRSHSNARSRSCDSDSGEDVPLSFLAINKKQTETDSNCTPQLDQTLPARQPVNSKAPNDTITSTSNTQNEKEPSVSNQTLNIIQKRKTRSAKRKIISKVAKKRRFILAAQKKKLASVMTRSTGQRASDSTVTLQPPKMTEQPDPEIPEDTASKSCPATTSVNGSTEDSIPFKLPFGLITRKKYNQIKCPSHLMNSLQELLSVPPGTYNYCKVCKRCELLSKYEKVLEKLPVSDENEPDILEATPRDVYDFDSEDEGLKLLRRGRELVRNVLTTKRFPMWLSNLEMTLKKTMFQDANKLGTLQRNILLERDDVTVNKIITRIDYLNQCLAEDKKEFDAIKPKRKKNCIKKVVAIRGKRFSKINNKTQKIQRFKKSSRRSKEYRKLIRTSIDSGSKPSITVTARSPQQGPSDSPSVCSSPLNVSNVNTDLSNAPVSTTEAFATPPLSESHIYVNVEDDDSSSLHLYLSESSTGAETSASSVPPAHTQFTFEPMYPYKNSRRHRVYIPYADTHETRSPSRTVEYQEPDWDDSQDFSIPIHKRNVYSENFLVYSEKDTMNEFPTVEQLTYRPTLEEFEDPIKYMQKIEHEASKYGICKIVPPKGFHVPCHLDDNSMFTTINQYLGRLYQRWGPTIREMTGIQIYLAKINPRERDNFIKCPMFDGVELDLVKLYNAVLEHGGIEELLAHRDSWARIAQQLSLVSPRGKPDHKKLEKLYCKHVLPYESLTPSDRENLLSIIDRFWKERYRSLLWRANRPLHYQKRMLGECESDDDDPPLDLACETIRNIAKPCFDRLEECTSKGRTMNLSTYRRLAAQIQAMRFPPGGDHEPTTSEIEEDYWKILSVGKEHVCVLSACIDTSVDKLGHTYHPDGPGGSHPWNLKRLGENPLNVLSFLGKTLSVTEPTLCLNQLYSTNCWHKDPHLLAWMDYMHAGATKIWYAVSDSDSGVFRETMEHLAPFAVQNKGIWLTSDTTMVPPAILLAKDVKLHRIEQNPGEFIVVFPGAYASSIATGLTISESVYFEDKKWIHKIDDIFRQMRADHEPGMFSNIVLLFRMARDPLASLDVMPYIHKSISEIVDSELMTREMADGLNFQIIQVKAQEDPGSVSWPNQDECSICRAPLILSKTVRYNDHRLLVCLTHGMQLYEAAPAEERGTPPPVTVIYSKEMLLDIQHFVWRRMMGEDVFSQPDG